MKKIEYLELLSVNQVNTTKKLQNHIDKIIDFFKENNCKNISYELKGKRELAYKIKKHTKGFFIIFTADAKTSKNYHELENKIKAVKILNKEILKNFICLYE